VEVVNKRRPPDSVESRRIDSLDHVAKLFPFQQAVGVLDRHKPLSLTPRAATLGPITVIDLAFDVDTWIRCAEERPYYQVNVLARGQMELLHRGSSIASAPGLANVCLPEGELSVPRWSAGTRMIALRVNRDVLEDELSEAVGRELMTQIDFNPSIVTTTGPARTWMHMFSVLAREIFQPDNALIQPLVAAPFVRSLMNALLLATDHPYREVLGAQAKFIAPQSIRPAVDIIEAGPHLPLTVESLARQCQVSSRALHQGFVRHLGMPPMAYLRQVRLRRAHRDLLASDPSIETVASIAKRWGYTNPGRFAAAHAARYGETPAATLHRSERAIRAYQPKAPVHTARP
jgi:AraC-like DNA-binding protein